ncbi:MAG: hypothetical protein M1486_00050 [Gammaproteobacteria bacterium]|nr:hypothetical protein [Gammaproteobacteria bacterium]
MNWKRGLIAAITRSKYKSFLVDTCNPEKARERLWTKEILPLMQQSTYWSLLLEGKKSLALEEFPILT